MYARDFLDAQECTTRAAALCADSARRDVYLAIANELSRSQRFHIPYELNVSDGKQWPELWPQIRLPFELTAIHCILPAASSGDLSPELSRAIVVAFDNHPQYVGLVTLIRAGRGDWRVAAPGPVAIRHVEGNQLGIVKLLSVFDSIMPSGSPDQFGAGVMSSLARTADLCLMLSLANVTTETVYPDAPLQKARQRRGKTLLPSYRVLKVGGEVWHHRLNHTPGSEGEGYRSHMRRGHVRRLDAERQVWVRPTYVQGRKEGFAGKEYHLAAA